MDVRMYVSSTQKCSSKTNILQKLKQDRMETIKEVPWLGVFTGNPSLFYVGFLMVAASGYLHFGGDFAKARSDILINYLSCICEVVGLLMLQHQIKGR